MDKHAHALLYIYIEWEKLRWGEKVRKWERKKEREKERRERERRERKRKKREEREREKKERRKKKKIGKESLEQRFKGILVLYKYY